MWSEDRKAALEHDYRQRLAERKAWFESDAYDGKENPLRIIAKDIVEIAAKHVIRAALDNLMNGRRIESAGTSPLAHLEGWKAPGSATAIGRFIGEGA